MQEEIYTCTIRKSGSIPREHPRFYASHAGIISAIRPASVAIA